MRIIHGTPQVGRALTAREIEDLLARGAHNLQLGTVDRTGEANIHTVWFVYENGRIYVTTETESRKAQNIARTGAAYFAVDAAPELMGVRGKARARIVRDVGFNVSVSERIILKYARSLDGRLAREILAEVESGAEIVLELEPRFYSSWVFGL